MIQTLVTPVPSTAINFDESDYATYRSVAFNTTDAFSGALARDEIMSY